MKRRFYFQGKAVIILLSFSLLSWCNLNGQDQIFNEGTTEYTFSSSGNFTVPDGYSVTVTFEIWGGGGGGGYDKGGGGGGGGFATGGPITLTGGATAYSVVVGTGGSGGSLIISSGGLGGFSSFQGITATGGGGGAGFEGPGGSGGSGNSAFGVSGGSGGGSGGSGGKAGGMAGGAGGTNSNRAGAAPGGGGAGGSNNGNGGAGGNGQVVITVQSSVLPVELSHFSADIRDDKVELNWTTASELHNDFFQIEHSRDGVRFQPVGKVKGAGTTTETLEYHFLHRQAATGANYYRLKQVDFDGAFEYSDIVVAELRTRNDGVEVYPNPTVDKAVISLDTRPERMSFSLFTLAGKQVDLAPGAGDARWEIDLSGIPAGIYVLRINVDGQTLVKRIVKR